MCDKEEEDCQEHPHDGNWSGKRPEGPGMLDCITITITLSFYLSLWI